MRNGRVLEAELKKRGLCGGSRNNTPCNKIRICEGSTGKGGEETITHHLYDPYEAVE